MPRCYMMHTLFICIYLWKINNNKWISPVIMFHMVSNTSVCPSYQWPLHGKEGPSKNMLRIGWGVHDLINLPVFGEVKLGLTHLTLTTPVLGFFCYFNPNSWHELTQFIPKIFRRIHLFSAVYMHKRSMHFVY